MFCLFRCKIFAKVKYFTCKIFYWKYFHFIESGLYSENAKKKKSIFQQNEGILRISQNQTTTTPPATQTTTRSAKTHPPPPWHSIDHPNPHIKEWKKKKKKEAKAGQPSTITHKPSPYHGSFQPPKNTTINGPTNIPTTHHHP